MEKIKKFLSTTWTYIWPSLLLIVCYGFALIAFDVIGTRQEKRVQEIINFAKSQGAEVYEFKLKGDLLFKAQIAAKKYVASERIWRGYFWQETQPYVILHFTNGMSAQTYQTSATYLQKGDFCYIKLSGKGVEYVGRAKHSAPIEKQDTFLNIKKI